MTLLEGPRHCPASWQALSALLTILRINRRLTLRLLGRASLRYASVTRAGLLWLSSADTVGPMCLKLLSVDMTVTLTVVLTTVCWKCLLDLLSVTRVPPRVRTLCMVLILLTMIFRLPISVWFREST